MKSRDEALIAMNSEPAFSIWLWFSSVRRWDGASLRIARRLVALFREHLLHAKRGDVLKTLGRSMNVIGGQAEVFGEKALPQPM